MLHRTRSRRGSDVSRRTTKSVMSRISIKSFRRKESAPPWPAIYNLLPELVDRVCDEVSWPHDIAALTRTCRGFFYRGRPFLYRSILISPKNPEATKAMLRLIEFDPQLASLVQAIVFDESATEFYAPIQPGGGGVVAKGGLMGKITSRDRMVVRPNIALSELVVHLARVMANMRNLSQVYMRMVHPCLLNPTVAVAPGGFVSKLCKQVVWNKSFVPYDTLVPEPPHLTWFILSRLPKVRYLSASLFSKSAPLRGSVAGLRHLHTLHLGGSNTFIDPQGASTWNIALRAVTKLHTLMIANIGPDIDVLLAGCKFAGLANLQLYKVRADVQPDVLGPFIETHAATLEVLALCVAGNYTFPDKVDFPRLHTLRVDNVSRLHCFECVYARESALHGGCKGAVKACARFAGIVARHPRIIDIAMSGILDYDAVRTIYFACAKRKMRRLMVGDTVAEAVSAFVPPETAPYDVRRRIEWWVFYELMFKGLELEKPAYRPSLFSTGKIHKRH